ncbi:3'-5' exonuclease [Shewanella algae]|uniref:3'-5' exonuclease n=2 Tax=Shewanella algae TaxID=38313 RepID=UPI0031F514EC
MKIAFLDTETTGLPDWKSPSDAEHQPHLVQLACILADDQTGETLEKFEVIVKPDGWIIPDEVAAIHGITTERALAEGIPEREALDKLLELVSKADKRGAHNKTFDQRIIRIGLKRYGYSEEVQEAWAQKDDFECTMRLFQKKFGGKSTALSKCFEQLTGKTLEDAHTAMADTKACMEVYFSLNANQGTPA